MATRATSNTHRNDMPRARRTLSGGMPQTAVSFRGIGSCLAVHTDTTKLMPGGTLGVKWTCSVGQRAGFRADSLSRLPVGNVICFPAGANCSWYCCGGGLGASFSIWLFIWNINNIQFRSGQAGPSTKSNDGCCLSTIPPPPTPSTFIWGCQ